MFGEQNPLRYLTYLMPGPADTLQAAGDRRRGAHLYHQIDAAHVDAEFEARRGYDGFEPPGLQVVLDSGSLFLADRTVMCARQHGFGAVGLAAAHDVCGGTARYFPVWWSVQHDSGSLGVDLVDTGGEPFGEAA